MSDTLSPIFEEAIAKHIFPGAVVWLERDSHTFAHRAFGTTAYDAPYSRPVTQHTLYDVASLTKLFTTTAFLIAARPERVSTTTPVAHFLPEFGTTGKKGITLRHLLQHNSGIEIAIQALTDRSPGQWIQCIAQAPLHSLPGGKVLYSCTNFFLLARIIEKLCGQPLDEFTNEQIFKPLQLQRTSWQPLAKFPLDEIAPTEREENRLWHGIVHDEAARAWQEYSGHAGCGNSGLFSTAQDLARFTRMWCNNGVYEEQPLLTSAEVASIYHEPARELDPIALRGLGWQLQATFFMSEKAPADAAGHTGFTGPSLWHSRSTQQTCIILNNRVYPTRNAPASRFPIHRRIARWLITQTNSPEG